MDALTRFISETREMVVLNRIDYFWEEHNLNIIYDGHHPTTGKRHYVVKEDIELCELSNAWVVGIKNFKVSGFSDTVLI